MSTEKNTNDPKLQQKNTFIFKALQGMILALPVKNRQRHSFIYHGLSYNSNKKFIVLAPEFNFLTY
jgi:hypothetical protein